MASEPEQVDRTRGTMAAEISNAIVRLIKAHGDRGPTECRTILDGDLVIVSMRGGFSRLENTLFESGRFLDVRSMRHVFQDTMEERFTAVIERITDRQVAAFMSASHQRPDVQVQVFLLDAAGLPTQVESADATS